MWTTERLVIKLYYRIRYTKSCKPLLCCESNHISWVESTLSTPQEWLCRRHCNSVNYKDDWICLYYFCNPRDNSEVSDAFIECVTVTMRCRACLIISECYSSDLLQWLEHSLGINGFRSTWPYLIVEFLATQAKFLKPSGYCSDQLSLQFSHNNCFFFIASAVLWLIFEPVTHKFPRCPWGNGYRRRNWTQRHEFKSWTDCISHSTNTLGKGMNPIILPPAMGK